MSNPNKATRKAEMNKKYGITTYTPGSVKKRDFMKYNPTTETYNIPMHIKTSKLANFYQNKIVEGMNTGQHPKWEGFETNTQNKKVMNTIRERKIAHNHSIRGSNQWGHNNRVTTQLANQQNTIQDRYFN